MKQDKYLLEAYLSDEFGLSKREIILNSIQNEIQENSSIEVKTEVLGEYSKLIFNFQFN